MKDEAIWQAEGVQKRTAVRGMFAEIAPTYDLLNSLICLRLHYRWRNAAVRKLDLKPGEDVVDLCCGTGDFMTPLRKAVGQSGGIVGMDFCLPMLEVAKKKAVPGDLSLGDACALPVQSSVFDAVTVGWGIRNVPEIDKAHSEIARVLRPGGRFISLDMSVPRNRSIRGLSAFMFNTIVPAMGSIFGKTKAYTYLPKSTEKFMSREELKNSMEKAGFVNVAYQDLFFGNVCLHWGTKP